jgi:phosphoglycerate dehydrogenase-like enzyme
MTEQRAMKLPKVLVILPSSSHPIAECLTQQAFGDVADYRVLPATHNFAEDASFPDPTIEAIACLGAAPTVDAMLAVHAPKARWVHSFSAGVDAILGPELKQRDDVQLTNAKGAFSESLAEFALFGIMYFAKRLPHTLSIYEQRNWEKFQPTMVRGATLGIVGYGDIGEKIARMASVGFGMRVLAVKRRPESVSVEARQWVEGVWSTDDVDEVLAQSDYVCGILPGTPATHQFFNAARFKAMKSTAIVMNLGRGSTLSSNDLVAALDRGDIKGAVLVSLNYTLSPHPSSLTTRALSPQTLSLHWPLTSHLFQQDVQEQEPLPSDSPLYDVGHEKLLLTPHCADATPCYWPSAARVLVDNARLRGQGIPFPSLVDKKIGY